MSHHHFLGLLLSAALTITLPAAISLPSETPAELPTGADGPAKEALDIFKEGRHAKAVELATPLAEKGNSYALYLLGFAHETGQGADPSRDKALEYYRKAAAAKNPDAIYRMSFLLIASEDPKQRDEARLALEGIVTEDPAVAGRILGEAHLRGAFTPEPDADKAAFWWQRASEAGDIPSILLLAGLHEGQFGFPKMIDHKQSATHYAKAAGLGHAGAMANLGSRLLSGDESIRDEAKGLEWLKKAIAAKEYVAYLALGDYQENVKKDLKAALAEYERGKDAGQIDCMLRVADFYLEGKGVEKDEDRGKNLLIKAADSGNPVANLRVAAALLSGEKAAPAEVMAGYARLLAAANGGLSQAQNEIGLLYLSGKLGLADGPAGVAWLTRASQGGNAQAQNNLAALHERGLGSVQKNIELAGQLYLLAANQGHSGATLALARLVNDGIGTKADPIKAWALATIAGDLGEKAGTELAASIDEKFDEAQRAAAAKELETMKNQKPVSASETPPPTAPK